MKWIDLYNFLTNKAHEFNNLENNSNFWNQHVVIYNVETGDENSCQALQLDNKMFVLAINHELLNYKKHNNHE